MMLYMFHVRSVLDYVANYPNDRETSKIGVCAGGFLKHKGGIGENEKEI